MPASSSPAMQVLEVEDIGGFAKSPLALEDFSEKIKQHTLQDLVIQMESKNYEIWQGLFREIVEAPDIFI
jgi:hypothetical protein